MSPHESVPTFAEYSPIPIAEFRERVLELYRPPLRSKKTCYLMRRSLDLLMALDGLESTAQCTPSLVARWVTAQADQGAHPNTTHIHLRALSAAFNIGVGEGWLRANPIKARRGWVRKLGAKRPRVLSREEIKRVLDLARREVAEARPGQRWVARRLYALVSLLAYTGLRRQEALTLRCRQVNLRDRMIYLESGPDQRLKTEASAAPVPIAEALVPVLRGWMTQLDGDEEWLFPGTTRKNAWIGGRHGTKPLDVVKQLCARAGVPGATIQTFRHSWATHAEYWGFSDIQIMRVLRHTTIKTQLHYRHAETNNLRAMVAGIDFGAGADAEKVRQAAAARAGMLPALAQDFNADDPPPPPPDGSHEIPGYPDYRVREDWVVWTCRRQDGHRRKPGEPHPPWRVLSSWRSDPKRSPSVRLTNAHGSTRHRTLKSILRDVFGYVPPRPVVAPE